MGLGNDERKRKFVKNYVQGEYKNTEWLRYPGLFTAPRLQ